MKIMKLTFSYFFSVLMITGIFNGCSSSSTDDEDEPDCCADVVTISGQVAVSDDDAATALSGAPPSLRAVGKGVKPRFATIATAVLPSAEVTLVEIASDGTETEISTTTTDSGGNYSLEEVPPATGGTGESTDFYYEIRVSSGDLDIRAPAAPTSDATVNVSPESNLSAKIISDVVDAPTLDDNPVPAPAVFETVSDFVANNVDDLETEGSITVPSVASDSEDETIDFANGIAAAGGDAEKTYKAFQFEAEFTGLVNDTSGDVTTDDIASYIKRVIREGCDQPTTGNPLPAAAAEAMAESLDDGTTYTPEEIVSAYNDNSNTDANTDEKVEQFAEILTDIDEGTETIGATLMKSSEVVGDENQIGLYVKRDLHGDTFDTTTELDPDQALAFLQTLPDDAMPCQFSSVDITSVIADLTGNSDLEEPTISDTQIYHDSGFGCQTGGHFRAEVDVYAPGTTVNSMSVRSSDTTALGGDGVHALIEQGSRWVSQTSAEGANGICVTFNSEVTYTITANLGDGSTLTDTVSRNHPNVPEADTTVNGEDTSTDSQNPDVVTDMRPVYEWESPEEKLAEIDGAPAGSVVKYTYEFSHVDGSTGQSSPLPGCDMVSSGALYSVNNFIPTVDCDPEACSTSSGVAAEDIVCRMNIQTFLVDAYDRYLGQAAGHFPIFCVDTSSPADGDCGD